MDIYFGNIIIPEGKGRDEYVKTAYNRERVSVLIVGGKGFIKDCYIDRQSIKDIYFPETSKSLGSYVCLIVSSTLSKPTIIANISQENESQLITEHGFSLDKSCNGANAAISGNGKDGNVVIDAGNTNGSASLNINISGKNNSGDIAVSCNGTTTIYSDNLIELKSSTKVDISSTNEDDGSVMSNISIDNNEIKIVSDGTIDINNGNLTIEP